MSVRRGVFRCTLAGKIQEISSERMPEEIPSQRPQRQYSLDGGDGCGDPGAYELSGDAAAGDPMTVRRACCEIGVVAMDRFRRPCMLGLVAAVHIKKKELCGVWPSFRS